MTNWQMRWTTALKGLTMTENKIPCFQGIDLTGIDPFLAIQASTLLDTCSLEIFRLIALLHKCKQENPATEKLADDLTEALKAILDAHERDVVVRNNNETAQEFHKRALLAEKHVYQMKERIDILHSQIHELEAELLKERNSHTDAYTYMQGDIVNLQTQVAMLQQSAYVQSLKDCVQSSTPILYADGRQCIIDQRGKFI